MAKYKNKKVIIDGNTFDSKLEAQRYIQLCQMCKDGRIRNLRLQPEYELIPAFTIGRKKFRKAVYRADFAYIDTDTGEEIVEDTKGYLTETYKFKRKLFAYRYKKEIKETKRK